MSGDVTFKPKDLVHGVQRSWVSKKLPCIVYGEGSWWMFPFRVVVGSWWSSILLVGCGCCPDPHEWCQRLLQSKWVLWRRRLYGGEYRLFFYLLGASSHTRGSLRFHCQHMKETILDTMLDFKGSSSRTKMDWRGSMLICQIDIYEARQCTPMLSIWNAYQPRGAKCAS